MNKARILIAGTNSGSGKTTLTCAILAVLKKRGLNVQSYKCGPDYIDPMFHKRVLNIDSYNIDYFMTGKYTEYIFELNSRNTDICVIEGVMGFYDGVGFENDFNSSNYISLKTKTPAILVVNCKGTAPMSVCALISGFINFAQNNIKGVILNYVSENMYPYYSKSIAQKLNVEVLGYIPKMNDVELKSRNLGLILPDEIENFNDIIGSLARIVEKTVNIDRLIEIAQDIEEIPITKVIVDSHFKLRAAVAKDSAFCFYYEDSLNLLECLGVELTFFSPLKDKSIPENIDLIILGGGYPELYHKELSKNKAMIDSIREAYDNNIFIYAECGGFMYLHENLCGSDMIGIVKGNTFMTSTLKRFGYITLKSKYSSHYFEKGVELTAHEFHYSNSDFCGDSFTAIKSSGKIWDCIIANENLFAGFPHINFWGNLDFIKKLLGFLQERKKEMDKHEI